MKKIYSGDETSVQCLILHEKVQINSWFLAKQVGCPVFPEKIKIVVNKILTRLIMIPFNHIRHSINIKKLETKSSYFLR